MRLSREPVETGNSVTSEPSICEAPLGHGWVPTVFWASQEVGVSRNSVITLISMGVWCGSGP